MSRGRSESARRPGLRILALGLVLLGVCVFAWGLRYKLSLYSPPHSIARRMPAAKLLTGKKRAAVPVIDLRRPADSGDLAALALTGLLLLALSRLRATSNCDGPLLDPAAGKLCAARVARGPGFTRPPPRL